MLDQDTKHDTVQLSVSASALRCDAIAEQLRELKVVSSTTPNLTYAGGEQLELGHPRLDLGARLLALRGRQGGPKAGVVDPLALLVDLVLAVGAPPAEVAGAVGDGVGPGAAGRQHVGVEANEAGAAANVGREELELEHVVDDHRHDPRERRHPGATR